MTRAFAMTARMYRSRCCSSTAARWSRSGREEPDGYTALQLGAGMARPRSSGHRHARPFRQGQGRAQSAARRVPGQSEDALVDVGAELIRRPFRRGSACRRLGTSIGKGFAGAMKRHNFRGLRASHGVSISHRSHGSTGNSQDPGKVWKGKKMAGHMGDARATVQNLEVVDTDVERGLILIMVKGAVPGRERRLGAGVRCAASASCRRTRRSRPASRRSGRGGKPRKRAPESGRRRTGK